MFKKLVKSFLLVFGVLCFTSNQVFSAKLEFQIEISQVIYDGDTLHFNKKVKLQGEMKNHTQRLAIATLDDGTVLHLEMWVTLEKDGKNDFVIFQHKYYTSSDDLWTVKAVGPQLKFRGNQYDNGHYTFRDPQSSESLEVFYKVHVKPI